MLDLNMPGLKPRDIVQALMTEDGEHSLLLVSDGLRIIGAAWLCDCGQLNISGDRCDVCLRTEPDEPVHEWHSGDVVTA